MAMSVTVLCPNGRRNNIKVNPNTSILQIIEDACKKEKFDPDQYDLKHLNRTLDSSSTVRYTNLPNKCQLELVKCAVPRKSSVVTVNIASEIGSRMVFDFSPDTTLWDILHHHEQQGNGDIFLLPKEDDEREAVIVYMMRRVSGPDLKTTTLKSLGLTKGKCMLRHSFQTFGNPQQAHVSAPLPRHKPSKAAAQIPQVLENNIVEDIPEAEIQAPQLSASSQENEKLGSIADIQAMHPSGSQKREESTTLVESTLTDTKDNTLQGKPCVLSSTQQSAADNESQNRVSISDDLASQSPSMPMDVDEPCNSATSVDTNVDTERIEDRENVIKLGSRDAFLFNMDDAPPTNLFVEDETFFDLTVQEVKGLYREQQQMLRSFEDAPLMTKQMREMHETSKVLCALNQFPVTQLRIYFPDNNVIQAAFKPTETVAKVMDFIRQFLCDPSVEFSLSMRHPQRELSSEMTLVSADCVPNARLYFMSSLSSPYLNEETLDKKSSFSSSCPTVKSRRLRRSAQPLGPFDESEPGTSSDKLAATNVCHNEVGYQKRTNTSTSASGAVKKVPKWFKSGK